jgi:hypothetical protein
MLVVEKCAAVRLVAVIFVAVSVFILAFALIIFVAVRFTRSISVVTTFVML